jgi:hypothetical protein
LLAGVVPAITETVSRSFDSSYSEKTARSMDAFERRLDSLEHLVNRPRSDTTPTAVGGRQRAVP